MVIHNTYCALPLQLGGELDFKKGASFDKLHTGGGGGGERAREANFSGADTHEGWSYFIQSRGLLIFCCHYW